MDSQFSATTDTVCIPELCKFRAVKKRLVTASFSGEEVPGNGWLPPLGQRDRRLELTKAMAQVLPDARNPALADLTSCQDWWAKPVSAAAFAFSLCAAGTLAAGWDGTGAGASRDQPQEAAES